MQGICRRCRLLTKLVGGHSIPNAFIRHARGEGALKYIPLGRAQKIANARSTGSDHILCSCCDGKLGKDFDEPVFSWTTKSLPADTCIEDTTLAQFLASVFWRASLSNHHYYRGFLGPMHALTPLLEEATYDSNAAFEIASYDVKRMTDETFSGDALERLIIFPVLRKADTNTGKQFVFLRAVFGGCIWSMALPSLQPLPNSLLNPDGTRNFMESVNLQNDPELKSFVVGAIEKLKRGEVSHRLKRTPSSGATKGN